jgi:hypothetical protein
MFSDIYMVIEFSLSGDWVFAIFILVTIIANIFFQLLVVYAQNYKMGRRRLLREAAITILMLKPAIDAYRVAQGEEKDPQMNFDHDIELAISRVAEIVFESAASGVMQMYAFMITDKRTNAAALSLICSALTTGFVSTVVSWDLGERFQLTESFSLFLRNAF